MSGRVDYQERKQKRIEHYKERSEKNGQEAKERYDKGSKIIEAINGQPLLIGHHSERRHRADLKRIDNNFRKANELQEKSDYYEQKAEAAKNNNAISSDDPEAIQKLERQLKALEKLREDTKKTEHTTYELNYISADIRRIKARIEEIKELEQLDFKNIKLKNGTIIHNKEQNRIQILFDEIPSEVIRGRLKASGFKWARSQGAWQRMFNKKTIYEVNWLIREGVLEVIDNEKMS